MSNIDNNTFGSAVRWNLIGSGARVVITLFCQLALLRILGPGPAGYFAIFLNIVGIGTVLSDGGMTAALTRSKSLDDELIRNALFVVLCYATGIAVLLLLCTPPIMAVFHLGEGEEYIPLIAILNVIPLGLSSVPLGILRRQYRSRELQSVQVIAYFFGFGLIALPLTIFSQSAIVMVTAFTVQSFVTAFGSFYVTRCPLVPRISGASKIQATSWRAVLSNIMFYFSESAAGILTAHTIGSRALGLYGTALNLLRMPTDVLVNTLQAPLLVSAASDNGGESTRERFLATFGILSAIIFPVFFTVFYTGNEIVRPLLGVKWVGAGGVFSIVGLIMIARLLSMLSGAVVWGRGRILADSAAQAASLAVIILSFVIFRPENATSVAWVVFASVGTRMIIQLTIAVRACAITLSMLWSRLLLPTMLTAWIMLPMRWICPLLLPKYEFAGFVATGAAAAALLTLRVALGCWLTPEAWSRNLMSKLYGLRGRLLT